MAPRSAKAKKAADLKVSENEVPSKGKGGKEKKILEPTVDAEEEEVPVVEKKPKRGKKAAEGKQANGDGGAAKRGKKKNDDESAIQEPASNEENSEDAESVPTEENEQIDDNDVETNGQSEEAQVAPTGRGRKKQPKKEISDLKPKETSRGKRNLKQNEADDNKKEINEDKPKGRGRGKKALPKPDIEPEEEEDIAEEESKPVTKGRKKTQGKSTKEKAPESENEESQEEQKDLDDPEEEPEPKKGGRGKKNIAKKAKLEVEEKEDEIREETIAKKRKTNKKEDKGKGDPKDEEEMEEDAPEPKPAKSKRGQKKVAEKPMEAEEELQDTGEPTTKRRRKQTEDKASEDTKKKAPAKGKPATDYESVDFSNDSKNSQGKHWNFKIASWNVDGIRAWLGKGGLDYLQYEKPDILCLQELKCAKEKLPEDIANLPGYHAYWLTSDKDGYAGVGIYTTKLAMNVQYGLQDEELDTEGRIITAEYEQFYLICTYVPNSGRKLVTLPKRLKWNEEFCKHVKSLDKKKPVIICGDMNVSHKEIDLTNPKTNRRNAGFTDEERAGMTELLGEGFVDTFRHIYPDKTGAYTFWTYMFNSRAKNVGWRLDYFIVSERLLPAVCDSVIREKVLGSDHCPVSLFLHLSSADKPKER